MPNNDNAARLPAYKIEKKIRNMSYRRRQKQSVDATKSRERSKLDPLADLSRPRLNLHTESHNFPTENQHSYSTYLRPVKRQLYTQLSGNIKHNFPTDSSTVLPQINKQNFYNELFDGYTRTHH